MARSRFFARIKASVIAKAITRLGLWVHLWYMAIIWAKFKARV
jgi:hypothetical protein